MSFITIIPTNTTSITNPGNRSCRWCKNIYSCAGHETIYERNTLITSPRQRSLSRAIGWLVLQRFQLPFLSRQLQNLKNWKIFSNSTKTAVVNSKSMPTPNPALRTRSMSLMSRMLQRNPGVGKPTRIQMGSLLTK